MEDSHIGRAFPDLSEAPFLYVWKHIIASFLCFCRFHWDHSPACAGTKPVCKCIACPIPLRLRRAILKSRKAPEAVAGQKNETSPRKVSRKRIGRTNRMESKWYKRLGTARKEQP